MPLGLGVLGTIFCVWMLVDCATKEPNDGNSSKVVWTLIIVFTCLIEAALYFFVRRPQRWAEASTRQSIRRWVIDSNVA